MGEGQGESPGRVHGGAGDGTTPPSKRRVLCLVVLGRGLDTARELVASLRPQPPGCWEKHPVLEGMVGAGEPPCRAGLGSGSEGDRPSHGGGAEQTVLTVKARKARQEGAGE